MSRPAQQLIELDRPIRSSNVQDAVHSKHFRVVTPIHPENNSKGMSRGGRVIGEALRGTRDTIGGGCKDPRGDRKPPREDGDGHEQVGY